MTREELGNYFEFDFEAPVLVVIQHAVLAEVEQAREQMIETMEAIKGLGMQTVLIYPNNDAGGRRIIEVIRNYENLPFLRCSENLDRKIMINLLRTCTAIVGNSSCGILEAPFLKLAAVNVGNRQQGRLRSENLIDVPHDRHAIAAAVRRALFDPDCRKKVAECVNPYGDGHSSERIVAVLEDLSVSREKLLDKRMTY
jgi:UDP-hydrolysing UDP-N-acetyl-D-glucosamine 2-epimerase